MYSDRRTFLSRLSFIGLALGFDFFSSCRIDQKINNENIRKVDSSIKLSLAEWSLHRMIKSGKLDHLQFAAKAKSLGFDAIEYVNQFFPDRASDIKYLDEMNRMAKESEVRQLLIMIDGEGGLANTDEKQLLQAVDNHKKWVQAAKQLDCHSIRVNCFGEGDKNEVKMAGIKGLSLLSEYAQPYDINVIVENHGGYSSDGQWMSDVIRQVNLPNCGTLPDFGNFCIKRQGGEMWGTPCIEEYDIYQGVKELLPYAKAISAKSYQFDEAGQETSIDYKRMMSIISQADYKGYIGIEYEGDDDDEVKGILKTKALLEQVINQHD